MAAWLADLHVHSRYSRATSRDCDLEHLATWARKKGVDVVATGDFTHPAWRAELRDKLVPAEPGLFRLRDDLSRAVDARLPKACRRETRFVLSVEISNIYKRHGTVRKLHNLVLVPDLERADALVVKLGAIGNLTSDGRPILGLDSHDLLEIVLEVGGDSFLVPAHVWTPWFALFGSRSGFDRIEDCFGELTGHVFALETGLSSDPGMNWRLSALDRFRLVSSSDAHSPQKVGREATRFSGPRDFFAMRHALATGEGFEGTIEFFPEEGKYHLDGHRNCGVVWEPRDTATHGGKCSECGKPVTVGVMSRVDELADRPPGFRPEGAAGFSSLVPLPEVIAELVGAGAATKAVTAAYERILDGLGAELHVLEHAPLEDVRAHGGELLAEALRRLRTGEVRRQAGYDGEYGVIRLFGEEELRGTRGPRRQLALMPDAPDAVPDGSDTAVRGSAGVDPAVTAEQEAVAPDVGPGRDSPEAEAAHARECPTEVASGHGARLPPTGELDPDQAAAVVHVHGPLLVVAGPGTGKTRTLTYRIAALVRDRGVPPERCLTITFTRRAADELRERLAALLPGAGERVPVHTFHGFGLTLLGSGARALGLPGDLSVATPDEQRAALVAGMGVGERRAEHLLREISRQKRSLSPPAAGTELAEAMSAYEREILARRRADLDDLVLLPVRALGADPVLREEVRGRHDFLSIDEYQDVDPAQYALVRLVAPEGEQVCAIGDPDQAIYGFRGADVGFFLRFERDFPGARRVQLTRNYRSTHAIVEGAKLVVREGSLVPDRRLDAVLEQPARITVHAAPTEAAEAEFVAHTIEQLVGGYSFFSVDSGRVEAGDAGAVGFGDIAVLYRSGTQVPALLEALDRAGIPVECASEVPFAATPVGRQLVAALRAGAPVEETRALLEASHPARDVEVVWPTVTVLARRYPGSEALARELALLGAVDLHDPRGGRVSLLTLHASKGLEFPVVFIPGCEEGLLPHRLADGDGGVDEERRLFFVGMTRAKHRLLLVHAARRLVQGKVVERRRSRFVDALTEELRELSAGERKRRDERSPQLSLFAAERRR